jgi:hypothetical protein
MAAMLLMLEPLSGKVLRSHNARMRRVAGLIGRRDALLAVAAVLIGLAIGYVDSRPTWDDTGITMSLILLSSAMVAGLSGRRPWLWTVLIGAWVPAFEFTGGAGPASLVALLAAAAGSAAGYALARVAEPA